MRFYRVWDSRLRVSTRTLALGRHGFTGGFERLGFQGLGFWVSGASTNVLSNSIL